MTDTDLERMRQYAVHPEQIWLSVPGVPPGPLIRVLIAEGIHPPEAARVLRAVASTIERDGFTPFAFIDSGMTMPGPRIAVRVGADPD